MKRAFTLLELLVTIALLAIIGGLVISQINLDEDGISSNINAYSMGQVRDALLAFRRDMGYFPAQGPLDANYQKLRWLNGIGVKQKKRQWMRHDHNFWQLFLEPEDKTDAEKWSYNPQTGIGWNGPYLNSNGLKLHGYDGFDHIYAIADNFSSSFKNNLVDTAYWAVESEDQWAGPTEDHKKYYPGSPYVLLKNNGNYYLISNGLDATLESTSNDLAYDTDTIIDLGP
tara:strand:+ start:26 stop:709 length:684 start_codon:yes stop_codon:yes gene_type:complete